MFSVKEVSEEEKQFKLLNDKLLAEVQVKDHEMLLMAKQNQVLQDKLQKAVAEEVSQLPEKDTLASKSISVDCLISALCKFQTNSDSILSCNEDKQEVAELLKQEVAELLKQFGKQKDAVLKVEIFGSNISDVQREGSKILQVNVTAEAVDEVIDKVITDLSEKGPALMDEDVQKQTEDQNKAEEHMDN